MKRRRKKKKKKSTFVWVAKPQLHTEGTYSAGEFKDFVKNWEWCSLMGFGDKRSNKAPVSSCSDLCFFPHKVMILVQMEYNLYHSPPPPQPTHRHPKKGIRDQFPTLTLTRCFYTVECVASVMFPVTECLFIRMCFSFVREKISFTL